MDEKTLDLWRQIEASRRAEKLAARRVKVKTLPD
jgi:hypothetical protein